MTNPPEQPQWRIYDGTEYHESAWYESLIWNGDETLVFRVWSRMEDDEKLLAVLNSLEQRLREAEARLLEEREYSNRAIKGMIRLQLKAEAERAYWEEVADTRRAHRFRELVDAQALAATLAEALRELHNIYGDAIARAAIAAYEKAMSQPGAEPETPVAGE